MIDPTQNNADVHTDDLPEVDDLEVLYKEISAERDRLAKRFEKKPPSAQEVGTALTRTVFPFLMEMTERFAAERDAIMLMIDEIGAEETRISPEDAQKIVALSETCKLLCDKLIAKGVTNDEKAAVDQARALADVVREIAEPFASEDDDDDEGEGDSDEGDDDADEGGDE